MTKAQKGILIVGGIAFTAGIVWAISYYVKSGKTKAGQIPTGEYDLMSNFYNNPVYNSNLNNLQQQQLQQSQNAAKTAQQTAIVNDVSSVANTAIKAFG